MNAKNITDIYVMPDGSYVCHIELFDDWNNMWETVPYAARHGDPAPVNRYILSEIATGNYTISQWSAPEPAQPVVTSDGPVVL
jgi:hypothetical protein